MERINHNIEPLYDRNSRILILGSFPSVKSREMRFFYGHPQNRFWRVIAALTDYPVPHAIEDKKKMLHENHIALWDTIASCEIEGSSDSSIKGVVPNNLNIILETAPIQAVYCNGSKSYELYHKYCEKQTGMPAFKLPSTSPANAACSLDRLIKEWSVIMDRLREV